VFVLTAFLSFTGYQCITIFAIPVTEKFTPYSLMFLFANFVVMTIMVVLDRFDSDKNIRNLMVNFFPSKNAPFLDRKRDNDLQAEID
jgi:hypothetical protein